MHSVSMSLLGYPELQSATSYRIHCYTPVTPAFAFSRNDVSSTIGHYLPSSYQGYLWLLDSCQETYCDVVPSCDSPSQEPKTCATSCVTQKSRIPCDTPTGQVITACKTTNLPPSPSCASSTQTKRYVSNCYGPTLCALKACRTFRNGSNCFGRLNYLSKSPRPLSRCRLGGLGYRSYQTLGFIPSGFSPSCYAASRYQPQNYFVKYYQYLNYGPVSYQPLSYSSSNFRSLSCIPSSFPPLRYLCSGSRPLNCW